MAHVAPLERGDLPGLANIFTGVEAAMGFVPNSMLTMAYMPQLTLAFSTLARVVNGGDLKAMVPMLAEMTPEPTDVDQNLPPALLQLIAFSVSTAAGCRYCQAHTSDSMVRAGGDRAKLDDILIYDTSPHFDDAERAVVALAFAAGRVPNEAAAEHFEALRRHYTERQIVQIVALISMFGFLNRWNDTMATALEDHPTEFAQDALGSIDWAAGKHGS
ncbi:MAG: carboxymuconolactone decarboxylase family protein [Gammaproteobacteria bacterium]|nr:carboxymuconolactone decarboxylase family protein [Gammaproteobacteria bacterium]